jgi:hypothetical protein
MSCIFGWKSETECSLCRAVTGKMRDEHEASNSALAVVHCAVCANQVVLLPLPAIAPEDFSMGANVLALSFATECSMSK